VAKWPRVTTSEDLTLSLETDQANEGLVLFKENNMANQKPIKEIRLSGIRATIWPNPQEDGRVMHSVSFSRLYKAEGAWRDATSFGRNDLLLVAKAAEMAFDWLVQEHQNDQPQIADE
jgi:hypothetical protein